MPVVVEVMVLMWKTTFVTGRVMTAVVVMVMVDRTSAGVHNCSYL